MSCKSPHEQMEILDNANVAYWIEDLIVSGYKMPLRFDVMKHSPDWLMLCEMNSGLPGLLVNVRNVGALRIVEG